MSFDLLKARIKDSPISTIIERYLTIVRKGSSTVALCPFHADTKPSMNINDSKGMYKCFACGAGGDHISFVKEYKKVDFIEALRECSSILGIPFEDYEKEKKANPRIEMAFRVLNASLKIYQKVAQTPHEKFTEFIAKRGLSPESIEKFQIGYATSGNVFMHYLETIAGKDGESARSMALDIGIVGHNKDRDSYYDFFRDRVMFPIHDHTGKQIRGYSARTVMADQPAKYINSRESFVFEKNQIMCGFGFAKHTIRQLDQVIVVEGNVDVIMMHQFGFTQTVGTMGIALSDQNIKLLSNMTKNVFLGMDSDAAGKKAMQKINQDFLVHGVLPRLLSFDPAKDPDEFLQKEGRIALMERMEKAPILIDVLIQELIPEPIPENITRKIEILQRVFALLAPLKENLAASERILTVTKTLRFGSDPATILHDYKEFLSRQKERPALAVERPKLEEVEVQIEEQNQQAEMVKQESLQKPGPLTKSEKVFLREIICHPEFLTQANGDEFLAYIGHSEVKKLFQWLVKIYFEIDEGEYVRIVQDELDTGGYSKEIRDIGTDALFNHGNRYNEKVILRMLKDYKQMLKTDQLKLKRRDLVERQKACFSQTEVDSLLLEITKIDKEILNLKN